MRRQRFASGGLNAGARGALQVKGDNPDQEAGIKIVLRAMTNVNFDELENAVLMVSNESSFTAAWVCRDTGKVYVRSEMGDEREPLPEDVDDSEQFIPVPDARSLDLGQAMVFGFIRAHLADEEDHVRQLFRRPGAYRRFGKLVDDRGLRDEWHRFSDEQTRAALASWCEENGLKLAS